MLLRAPGESTRKIEPSGLITHLAIETTAAAALGRHYFRFISFSSKLPANHSQKYAAEQTAALEPGISAKKELLRESSALKGQTDNHRPDSYSRCSHMTYTFAAEKGKKSDNLMHGVKSNFSGTSRK